jgi:hypothetical protein
MLCSNSELNSLFVSADMGDRTHHRGGVDSGEVDGQNAEREGSDGQLRFWGFADKPGDQVVLAKSDRTA